MHASFRELRGMIAMRHKFGTGDPEESDETEPAPPAAQQPAQCEATVPQVDSEAEEAECPVDVNQPLSPWESPGAPGEGRVRASAPPSATASPEAIPDSPEEDEAIQAAYRGRLERVFERMEQDEAAGRAELEPPVRDGPPPGPGTSASSGT
jgi:hypothetical protein